MSTAGDDVTLFTSVDQTADPQFFVRFMEEGHRLPDIVRSKEIIAAELRLSAGVRVLDVGCGPAIDRLIWPCESSQAAQSSASTSARR